MILPFTLSLRYNELRFKSNELDISGVTLLEEWKTLPGHNFLNPPLFYVRTSLALEVDTSAELGRRLNGTFAIYHTSKLKVWEKRWLHSASLWTIHTFERLFFFNFPA